MDSLCDWSNKEVIGYDRQAYLGIGKCVDFEGGGFGSSWVNSCGGSTGASTRAT